MFERVDSLAIETGDGVVFALPLAGVMTRFLAWLMDLVVVLALTALVSKVVMIFALVSADMGQSLQMLGFFVISTGYTFTCEWRMRGQTVGKRLFGIRVVDAEGLRLRVSQLILRNLLRAADMLPLAYAVGGVSLLLSSKAQRLGDLAAGTVVVRVVERELPALAGVLGDEFNTLAEHGVLAARLRREVEPQVAEGALAALLRRNSLEAEHRVLVFKDFADHLKSVVRFPEQTTLGMSDERFVQNVVGILFQKDRLKVPVRRT